MLYSYLFVILGLFDGGYSSPEVKELPPEYSTGFKYEVEVKELPEEIKIFDKLLTEATVKIVAEAADKRPKILVALQPKKDGKEVTCIPCDKFKAAVKNWKDCPFNFITENVVADKEVDYPFFCWQDKAGKWHEQTGWESAAQFEQEWKRTQGLLKPVALSSPIHKNYQQYGVAGMSMEYHLRAHHGIDTAGLNAHELQLAHNAVHAGVSAATINAYIRARRSKAK